MTTPTNPTDNGTNSLPSSHEDPASDCCIVPRAELERLRINQVRPARHLVILVTGLRPGGIGDAICRQLTALGHTVIAAERDLERGREAARAIRDNGGDIWFACLDAADEPLVERLMSVIQRRFGRLDAVVNNAGWAGDGPDTFPDLDANGFRQLQEANLVSAYVVTRLALLRFFRRQSAGGTRIGGTSIFLGSPNGQRGFGVQVAYACAKMALSALVTVGTTWHGREARFLLVRPGTVETDSAGWDQRREKNPQYAEIEGEKVPLGRLGQPDDIAALIAFLLSPQAEYIQGCEISCDGGLMATGNMLPGQANTDRDAYVDLITFLKEAATRHAA